jgi:hypothetical protein
MSRRVQGLCAIGVIMLGTAGCTVPESFRLNFWESTSSEAKGPTPYVDGSLEVVEQNTQGVLKHLGISAIASEEGSKFILHCTTRRGSRFDMILEQTQGPKKNQLSTRVDFAWEGKPDENLRGQIMTALLAWSASAGAAR